MNMNIWYTHVLLHIIVIYNWTSVSEISFLRFPRTGFPRGTAWVALELFSLAVGHLILLMPSSLWLAMAWERTPRMRLNPTVVPLSIKKNMWGGGGESHWKMVNFVGIKMVLIWENDMFWMSLKISMVFWRLHSGKNGVAKRKGRYTQHLGIPNKQVSIYVYMPLFKVRSVSCVSSNLFIEQTGCFWLPYQIPFPRPCLLGLPSERSHSDGKDPCGAGHPCNERPFVLLWWCQHLSIAWHQTVCGRRHMVKANEDNQTWWTHITICHLGVTIDLSTAKKWSCICHIHFIYFHIPFHKHQRISCFRYHL